MDAVTLFGLNKNGGFKVWCISLDGAAIVIAHGAENGVMQVKRETVKGKNIGRANETTPEQQACSEALSKIQKQKDKGYRESKEELETLPILPMLANDYLKQGHRISFPAYVSPKFDGVRCLAIRKGDQIILRSRGGKEYNLPVIQGQLASIMAEGVMFDGEVYLHTKSLEEISSATKKHNPDTDSLEFHIFDVFDPLMEQPFVERLLNMENNYQNKFPELSKIKWVQYERVDSFEEMYTHFKYYVSWGYEGVMVRNTLGYYESGKRSADLQKYKEFLDWEFPITDVTEDKNENGVFVVWDAVAKKHFSVTFGDFDARKDQLKNPSKYIGKKLTVKFQTRYKDSLLPQFPVGVAIRDYE